MVGFGIGIASIKEEIKTESTDIITDILNINTEIQNKEVKISHNKILAKADLKVTLLYLTQDERICEKQDIFPVMSFIDIANVGESNSCITDYQVRNILLNVNKDDENPITLQMEYEVLCKAFENKEQTIISDLYSLKYDLEFDSKDIEIINDSDGKSRTIRVVQNVIKKQPISDSKCSMTVYTVKPKDTLWEVSKKFRIKQESIINSNNLEEPYHLKFGEKLYIIH